LLRYPREASFLLAADPLAVSPPVTEPPVEVAETGITNTEGEEGAADG
jgi:hypothetical protein